MSLVAYGSSDESDSNDADDTTPQVQTPVVSNANSLPQSKNPTADAAADGGAISDEDDFPTGPQSSHLSNSSIDSLLKGLPAPKGPDQGFIDESDELEEEVKPKAAELESAPKPPPKKARQPVKIAIPALPDSDDEDGEPAKKKRKPTFGAGGGKGGLTALLPAPMHAAKKEANRILLPYSLGKKPKPATSVQRQLAKPSGHSATQDKPHSSNKSFPHYESDSDEEDDNTASVGNFFSLDSAKTSGLVGPSLPPVISAPKDSDSVSARAKSGQTGDVATVPLPPGGVKMALNLPAPHQPTSPTDPASVFGQPVDPNAPLTFKGGMSSRESHPTSTLDTGADAGQNMFYNMPYSGMSSYPEADDDEAFKHDEEFLRLQGKRGRGREEISIMEVRADDYTSPGDLTKYLSEETEHRSSKNKEDQPTHLQKRKHQIQFLAFEAKERELELKNQWSNNKFTKRQTQAKYGF